MENPSPTTSTYADHLLALTERFESARRADAKLRDVELEDLLRLVNGKRAIIACRFHGRPAVIRMFLEDDPVTSQREWDELQRIYPTMDKGHYRVVEPLYHSAEQNLIVVEWAKGTPMLKFLRQCKPSQRAAYMEPAARWLRLYSRSTEEWHDIQHRRWLNKAERAAERQSFDNLRNIESDIVALLHKIANRMDGMTWRTAILHGDFHPNNLLVDTDQLVGIDTGGSARTPLYKDMARFLVHMGRRCMWPSGQRRLGVDAVGLAAMADVFELNTFERQFALPFMIGCEALLRVETPQLSESRIRRAEKMYRLLRDDLAKL